MHITERSEANVHIFTLEGRVDTEGAMLMDITLHSAVKKGKHKMVLDMSGVSYIASAGLGTLADVLTRNQEAGGDLKLVALNEKVLRIFQIIGFDKYFSLYDSVPAAIKDFAS